MAGVLKKTTALTGLKVDPNARRSLGLVYSRLLRVLQKLPQDYIYRQTTEKLVKERVDILNNEPTIQDIEKKINCGQIEELILLANNELTLARNMLDWKPWENLISESPPNQWAWPPHK